MFNLKKVFSFLKEELALSKDDLILIIFSFVVGVLLYILTNLIFYPVMTVSAMETGNVEETEEGYYYFVNIAGRRVDYYDKYFTYKAKAGGYLEIQLAGLYEENDAGYHSVTLYGIKNGQIFTISKNSSIPILSYELLEDTGHADAANFFKVGDNLYPAIICGEWKSFSKNEIGCYQNIITNIPYFGELTQVETYLKNGDTSGNLNEYDEIDGAEEDASFAFTGFTATSEGRGGNIDVKWTGTTHDGKSDSYEKMEYYVSAIYSTGHGGGGGGRDEEGNHETTTGGKHTDPNILNGNISEKGFKKLYSSFEPPGGTYYLHSLKVLPTYTIVSGDSDKSFFGKIVKGKPCYIYFDNDGNITDVVEENEDNILNKEFYLLGVSSKKIIGGLLGHNISWTGTTRDSIISTLSIDDTLVDVFCSFTDYKGTKVFIDYHEIYPSFWDNGKPLRLRYKIDDVSHGFQFSVDAAKDYASMQNLVFTGDVYLTPSYTISDSIVRGLTTIVDVFNNEIRYIDDFDPKDPDTPETPVNPDSPDNPNKPLPDMPNLDDDFNIIDIFTYFLNVLNWLKNSIGQLPDLLSYLFPMLPSEFGYLITLGFLVSIFCRILGR